MKVQVSELTNAEVSHISLVERGANRIPFKIIKEDKENGMINLANIFKKEKPAPVLAVSAVILKSEDNLDEVKTVLVANGFSVDKMEKAEDGSVVFKQEDFDMKDVKAVKMSDEMVILTKSFSAYNMDTGTPFMERINAQGFFEGISTACEALLLGVDDILWNTTKDELSTVSTKVDKMLTEFHAYVGTLVSTLPASAFKADKEVIAVLKAGKTVWTMDEMKAKGMTDAEINAYQEKNPMAAKAAAKPTEGSPAEEAGETPEEEALEPDGKAKPKAKMKKDEGETTVDDIVVSEDAPVVDTPVEAIQKTVEAALKSFGDTLVGMSKQVLEVAKSQESVTAKLTEVELVAKAAQKAVKGQLIAGPTHGDSLDAEASKEANAYKSDFTLLDTAFQPHVRKSHAVKTQKH